MARSTLIENYNDFTGGVVTDKNPITPVPTGSVKSAKNFEFSVDRGATRRKALDVEGDTISGPFYQTRNSTQALGAAKIGVFDLKGVLDQFTAPKHDLVLTAFEGQGLVHKKGIDNRLADGVKDTNVTTEEVDITATDMYGVAWSPKLQMFAAVSYTDNPVIMISPDGVRWTPARSVTAGYSQFYDIVWSAEHEQFVAMSWQGDYSVAVSKNGYDWEVKQYSSGLWDFETYDITYSPEKGRYVAVGYYTSLIPGRIVYSDDGINWTNASYSGSRFWRSVCWSAELSLFVAVAYSDFGAPGQRICTSPDGVTWTLRTTPTDRGWTVIEWSPSLGKFIALEAGSGGWVLTSTNGTTWTESQVAAATSATWRDLIWSPELSLFVACASSGTERMMTSPNGTSWTVRDVDDTNLYYDLAWSAELNLMVCVHSSGVITSSDGITWNDPPTDTTLQDNLQEWEVIKGIPVGAVGLDRLYTLYNTADTTYHYATSFGLGDGALIRDFQGVHDGLDLDEKPSVMKFTVGSITGTFVEGEDILIGSGGNYRRFRIVDKIAAGEWGVDKSLLLTSTTEFDGTDQTEYYGWTVTGGTSGATGTITAVEGTGLSDAHRYNLINQGWTQTYMDSYAKSQDVWPSNVQVWFAGRDTSNNFSPTELDKVEFGNSRAPRGHVLLNPFKEWRHTKVPGVWRESVPELTYDRGFTSIAKFANRVVLTGTEIGGAENTVYISPVLVDKIITKDNGDINDLDFSNLLRFHQINDPTADIANQLVPTDGLVINIEGAGRIYKTIEYSHSLLVFAEKGVWRIGGSDINQGFRTDGFTVQQIDGAQGTDNPRTVVATEEGVYYWANGGILRIAPNERGIFIHDNITENVINKEIYQPIATSNRASAIGYYDKENRKVYWAYNPDNTSLYPEFRSELLILDINLGIFYPFGMNTGFSDSGDDLPGRYFTINGFVQDPVYSDTDGYVPVKFMVGDHINNAGTADIKHSIMEFGSQHTGQGGDDFHDFAEYRDRVYTLSDYVTMAPTYIEPWPDALGDTSRQKQGIWAFVHMTKTETTWFTVSAGVVDAKDKSSLKMRAQWDWHNTSAGGKWGTAREVYRHKRPIVPGVAGTAHDTGESVLTTKNKILGRGRALSLRFDAQEGYDAQLLGYAIPYSVENTP